MKISFLKKIKLFFFYRRAIDKVELQLKQQFNLRIDSASRMYTVFTIPMDLIEEPYNMRISDFDTLVQNYIKSYTKDLSNFLNTKGLNELYSIYEMKKLDNYNYLLIYGFSLFKSDKFILNLYRFSFFSVIALIILFLMKTFIH